MFIIRLLPAWSTNKGKRLVKAPKLFLNDTGLACHLAGYDNDGLNNDKTALGHLLENFVVCELYKQQTWSRKRCQLFHFRLATGFEVDLVLEDNAGRLVGIEVKSAATVNAADFKGLRALAEIAGSKFVRGIVLYPGTSVISFTNKFHAIPLENLWMTLPN